MTLLLAVWLSTAPFSIVGHQLRHWPWQRRAVAIESDPRTTWQLVQYDTAWVVTTKGDTIAVFDRNRLHVLPTRHKHKEAVR